MKADTPGNKLMVTGKVDPTRIKERVEYKTKKKVEILSPQPKKDGGGGGDKKPDEKPPEKKPADDKKPKEVLKLINEMLGCEFISIKLIFFFYQICIVFDFFLGGG